MKVGIIIPMYNSQDTIKMAINSCIDQTYNDIKIFIVNDGSTDRSREIVENFEKIDNRVHLINKQNGGVSSARNVGIIKAINEECHYICFLDADDFYANTYVEKLVNKIVTDGLDLVYCGYNLYENNRYKQMTTKFVNEDVLRQFILGKLRVITSGWMIKSTTIESIRFDESISWGEDHLFFYQIIGNSKKIGYVNEYLSNYVNHENPSRLSHFNLDKLEADTLFISKALELEFIKKNPLLVRILKEYRLPALLVYRLKSGVRLHGKSEIKKLYDKNYKYIAQISLINGMRSLKLKLVNFLLKIQLR